MTGGSRGSNSRARADKARVLADSSSIILLFKAGLLETFCRCYPVAITEAVYVELVIPGKPGCEEVRRLVANGTCELLRNCAGSAEMSENGELARLGPGECQTVLWAVRFPNSFVVVDDGQAAVFCRRHAIPFINALLVPRLLGWAECIPADRAISSFQHILSEGRYGRSVVMRAEAFTRRELSRFLPENGPAQTD